MKIHAASRGLFPVAQGGVKNFDLPHTIHPILFKIKKASASSLEAEASTAFRGTTLLVRAMRDNSSKNTHA